MTVEAGGERETNRYRAVLVANAHPWASGALESEVESPVIRSYRGDFTH